METKCFIIILKIILATSITQDQTSSRPNTLFDDADDLQKQLDNEARDRLKYGTPKMIWVLHLPTTVSNYHHNSVELKRGLSFFTDWSYQDQISWEKKFPDCGGRSQSPVDLPNRGLIKTAGARKFLFINFKKKPKSMAVKMDNHRLILYADYDYRKKPLIYGGALHSRRYVFHSLILHSPSEHLIEGWRYPMETQAIFISPEYNDLEEAIKASAKDHQSIVVLSYIYSLGFKTHFGLNFLLNLSSDCQFSRQNLDPIPLGDLCPELGSYAVYYGSLTVPPCTESVMWLIRSKTLPLTKEALQKVQSLLSSDYGNFKTQPVREQQSLNDRKIFYFQ